MIDPRMPETDPEPGRPHPEANPPSPKAPAPPLMGRAARPSAVRIRKPVVQAAVVGAALLLSGSLAWAFIIQPELRAKAREAAAAEPDEAAPGAVRPSERVTDQPADYDRLPDTEGLPPPRGTAPAAADATAGAPVRVSQPDYDPARPTGPTPASARAQAAASGLFFEAGAARRPEPAADGAAASAAADPATRDYGVLYSPHGLVAPVSPFELKAGAIVAGVLVTALDTARPGPVVAMVSQNVFDSITGRHLLIPQGSRLIGRHEGETVHGQTRAFLVWDRLILPNGKSLILTEEPGVDGQGAIGVPGRTDRRLVPLGVASLFAGAISTLGELARGGSGGEPRSFLGSAGDAASIEASRVGGGLIDRELRVPPSIRVAAGAPVRVMITRDLILEPFAP